MDIEPEFYKITAFIPFTQMTKCHDIQYRYFENGQVLIHCPTKAMLTSVFNGKFDNSFIEALMKLGWTKDSISSLRNAIFHRKEKFYPDFKMNMGTGENICDY